MFFISYYLKNCFVCLIAALSMGIEHTANFGVENTDYVVQHILHNDLLAFILI
jgi:hypothetical protein